MHASAAGQSETLRDCVAWPNNSASTALHAQQLEFLDCFAKIVEMEFPHIDQIFACKTEVRPRFLSTRGEMLLKITCQGMAW